jgi:hypothetical protein
VADAGFVGLGLIADDLAAIRATIGFSGLRELIADAGSLMSRSNCWSDGGSPAESRATATTSEIYCSKLPTFWRPHSSRSAPT